MSDVEFKSFEKIPRLSRAGVVTEKIDGTNAQIHITEAGVMHVGSRNRWITPEDDNFGFAAWCRDNATELLRLGPGTHYGEWWGSGIQRRYGLNEKRFSLFNTARWGENGAQVKPACCHVVPVLWVGNFDEMPLARLLDNLRLNGSVAAPGFFKPEGIVIYHAASRSYYKKTLEKDDEPKGKGAAEVQP